MRSSYGTKKKTSTQIRNPKNTHRLLVVLRESSQKIAEKLVAHDYVRPLRYFNTMTKTK